MGWTLQVAVTAVLLLAAERAEADVKVGGVAGLSVQTKDYFPTFYAGAKTTVERPITGLVSAHADARLQIYRHREDEDFGSWGFQGDLDAGLRAHLLRDGTIRPFIELHGGIAAVERIPYSVDGSNDLITGYLLGGAIGFDVAEPRWPSRVELAFDWPSFTTHDDSLARAGELSVGIATKLPR